ncbi:MAG: hypothetical protein ABI222_18145, partial [Opitutaceae bacterium]
MNAVVRLAVLSGLAVTAVFSETATTPFLPRHFPYEPQPPLLKDATAGDQLAGAKMTASGYDDEQRP